MRSCFSLFPSPDAMRAEDAKAPFSPMWRGRKPMVVLLALAGCACVPGQSAAHDEFAQREHQAKAAASAATSAERVVSAPKPPAATWLDALNQGDDVTANARFEALAEAARSTPKMRLVAAHLARRTGQPKKVKAALEGLEQPLAQYADFITQWRTDAEAEVGPYQAAAQSLAQMPRVLSRVRAAEAYLRAGQPKEARRVIDTAVKLADKTKRYADAGKARMVRARAAEELKQWRVAAEDWLWIIKRRPADPLARQALEGVDRIKGRVKLENRLAVLWRSATHDTLTQVLDTLSALRKRHRGHRAAISMAQAKAIARTRDWARARDAYDQTAALRSGNRAEARYHAARAAERLGDAANALKRYRALMRQHPRSGYAERASFRRASLLMRRGRDKDAAWAFAKYLSRYGKSKFAPEARYWRGLALVSSGRPKKARAIFSSLRKKSRNRRHTARLKQLEGVAAWLAGERKLAQRLWTELCREQPLTWPALMARARLIEHKLSPVPPLITTRASKEALAPALHVKLPARVKTLNDLGLHGIAEQALQRDEAKVTSAHPGRESEALCEAYGQLQVARRRYQTGNRAVSLRQLMSAPRKDMRWTWNCMYPKPYESTVTKAASQHKVAPELVYAVMRQESAFRTLAKSHAGAQGLMQVMPRTGRLAAAESGIELNDLLQPATNIALGAFYLGKLLGNFEGHAVVASAAYNAGPMAVRAWLAKQKTLPLDLWVARIPYKETRDYAGRVATNFARYQWLKGGDAAVTPPSLRLPATFDIGAKPY